MQDILKDDRCSIVRMSSSSADGVRESTASFLSTTNRSRKERQRLGKGKMTEREPGELWIQIAIGVVGGC